MTIEQTFEELMELARIYTRRSSVPCGKAWMKSRAIFDLLRKQELTGSELKKELQRLENWQEKQTTRDAV